MPTYRKKYGKRKTRKYGGTEMNKTKSLGVKSRIASAYNALSKIKFRKLYTSKPRFKTPEKESYYITKRDGTRRKISIGKIRLRRKTIVEKLRRKLNKMLGKPSSLSSGTPKHFESLENIEHL